jgi:uncharacterized protein
MTTSKQVLIGNHLFTWPSDQPSLIGTHCKSCGDYFFPKTFTCHNPACKTKEVEEVLLSRQGRVVSFSVMRYPPPPPFVLAKDKKYEPIPVAEVELPEGVRVIGSVKGCSPEKVSIGMEVEVATGPLYTNEQGEEVIGWMFRPV